MYTGTDTVQQDGEALYKLYSTKGSGVKEQHVQRQLNALRARAPPYQMLTNWLSTAGGTDQGGLSGACHLIS